MSLSLRELAEGHHSDRPDKVESENSDGFGIRRKLDELEQENADLLEQTKSLQEQNRSLQVLYTYLHMS